MRVSVILRLTVLALPLGCASHASFGQLAHQPSASPIGSVPKHQGVFDYALGKINPRDEDYGAMLETRREAVVESTIDDLYFWSNVVTLVLLCGLSAILLLQWRAGDKRELIAASLIAQLWNGRVSDRTEIERRTQQFNQLVEAHNAEVEQKLSQKERPPEPDSETAGSVSRSVRSMTEGERKSTAAIQESDATGLQQSHLLLQRRVEALQNSEQNLRQRVNQLTTLLDQERRRNGALKGA